MLNHLDSAFLGLGIEVYGKKKIHEQVVRVALLIKETSRQARVDIDTVKEKNQLKPGIFINAAFEFVTGKKGRIAPFISTVSRANSLRAFLF